MGCAGESAGRGRRSPLSWSLTSRSTLSIPVATHIPTTVVAAILLGTLLFFRNDFYAVGDRRTRWLALWVFLGLAVADIVIGLGYLSANTLAGSYSLVTRVGRCPVRDRGGIRSHRVRF